MKNKFMNYIIYGLAVIIIGVGVYLLLDYLISSKQPKLIFKLNGEENIVHNLGDPYIDLGITLTEDGVDISQNAIVTNNVDANKEGTYIVTYQYNDQTLKRVVQVKVVNSITLNGDEIVYLLVNGKYDDPKVKIISNGNDVSDQVVIDSNLDTSVTGKYKIEYSYSEIDKKVSREVYVSDFSDFFKINYDSENTVDSLNLNIVPDESKVLKYVLPDGTEKNINSTYTINSNGTYKFTIYDKYNNSIDKSITISNIRMINPINATCKASSKDGNTIVTVSSNNKIVKYEYNGTPSTSNTYTLNGFVRDIKVKLQDSDNQTKEITCSLDLGNLEIHFIKNHGYYDDAILIRSDNTTIFIDGGRGTTDIETYLRDVNVKKIDYLIGSHLHYDHVGAHAWIVRKFKVSNILYPDDIYNCCCGRCKRDEMSKVTSVLKSKKITARVPKIPSTLDLGDMKIYFLAPWSIVGNENDNSFVFILEYGNTKFMFTGDSEGPVYNYKTLTSKATKLGLSNINVDMVKYPHHGCERMDADFLKATKPKYVIVPNNNDPKCPSSGPISVIKNAGAKMYRQTDSKTGNIVLTSDGEKVTVKLDTKASSYAK